MPLVPIQTAAPVTTLSVSGQNAFSNPPLNPVAGQILVNLPDGMSWMFANLPAGPQWVPLSGGAGASSAPILWDGSQPVATRTPPTTAGQMLIDTVTHRPVAYADSDSTGAIVWVDMESQRTYVGRGTFDGTKLTEADNYGMPPGTVPDPVANPPAPNDIYIDTHSGRIITFN